MAGTYPLHLEAHGDREIVMTRQFNAPKGLVFEAWTRPELLKRWMGPPTHPLILCEIDLRVGGTYRMVARGPEGEMGWGGVYQEIVPGEKLVASETFDRPWYRGSAVSTLLLSEKDGRTTATNWMVYESQEARDVVLASPMRGGVEAGYDRLDQVLAELSQSN